MKRYQYKLNDETVSGGSFGKLLCLKAIDVVPGDTVDGTLSHKAYSDLMSRFIATRTYFDTYAFYVPYRVVWEDFPAWIADAAAKTMPTTTVQNANIFMQNPNGDVISAMLNRVYGMIWATFFQPTGNQQTWIEQVKSGAQDNNTSVYDVYARPTTFDMKVRNESAIDQTFVPSTHTVDTNPAFTVDELRSAMAQDRFQRMRDFYGTRYTDYLAAVGVKANWSILDEPECIAVNNNDWKATETRASVETAGENPTLVGTKFGQFQGDFKTTLRRTFCPEHGVIMICAVARSDVMNRSMGWHTICDKTDRSQFFSPEFSFELQQEWRAGMVDARRNGTVITPRFEDYRCGRNAWNGLSNFDATYMPAVTFSDAGDAGFEAMKNVNPGTANVFTGELSNQVQVYTDTRVTRRSPVPPAHKKVGV
jgi:hypothetical protein